MKRTIASIGFVAVGVSALHAQNAPSLSKDQDNKNWSISSSLRGFYDDNYVNQDTSLAQKSWGLEFAPNVDYTLTTVPNTLVQLGAAYDLKYYAKPDSSDQSVTARALVNHKFNSHIGMQADDRFVVAQEPEVMEEGTVSTPLRIKGSNIHNNGRFSVDLTDVVKSFDIQLSYANDLFAYQEDIYKTLLNRMEHDAEASFLYHLSGQTTGILNYSYGERDYSDRLLSGNTNGIESNIRDSRSHALMAGVNEQLTKTLEATVRAGAQYFDYFHADKTQWSPEASGDVTWKYSRALDGKLTLGVRHQHTATDVIGTVGSTDSYDSLVLDEEATSVYIRGEQKLLFLSPQLRAVVYGYYQHAKFNGGNFTDEQRNEDYFIADGKLSYEIVKNVFFADLGYTYTQLSSSGRPFERNRVYLGVTAKY